jgi:hypothetical protein
MTPTENKTVDTEVSEELRLLRKIDKKVDALDEGIETMKKTAAIHEVVEVPFLAALLPLSRLQKSSWVCNTWHTHKKPAIRYDVPTSLIVCHWKWRR